MKKRISLIAGSASKQCSTAEGAVRCVAPVLTKIPFLISALVLTSVVQRVNAADMVFNVTQTGTSIIEGDISATERGVVIPGTSVHWYIFPAQANNLAYAGQYAGTPVTHPANYVVTDIDLKGAFSWWTRYRYGLTYTAIDAALAESPLDSYLAGLGPAGVTCPWLGSMDSDFFYGVDLVTYGNAGGAKYTDGQTFQIANGACPELPGMVFGTTDVTYTPGAGFVTSNPYTGSATVYGDHTLSTVPEPSSLAMLGCGAFGLLARRRRAHA